MSRSGLLAAVVTALLSVPLLQGAQAAAQDTDAAAEIRALHQEIEAQRARIEELTRMLQAQSEAIAKLEQSLAPAPVSTNETPTLEKFKFNGLLQGWFLAGDHGVTDTFRIRRSELRFSGDLSPHAHWMVMIDPAKMLTINDDSINQAGRPLQDAYITIDRSKRLQFVAGQMKVPLSLEGYQSPGTLDTVDRALFLSDRARGGAYGDVRDIGVMLRGTAANADYQLAIFNGSGESQNDVDRNEGKSLSARVAFRPAPLPGLQLGIAGVWANGAAVDRPRRDRLGAELLYVRKGWKLKSEVMAGRDGSFDRLGYYVHAGRQLTPRFELIARVDTFDPDTDQDDTAAAVQERDYLAGFNYNLIGNNLRLQANLLHKTFTDEVLPSRNLLLINLQTSW